MKPLIVKIYMGSGVGGGEEGRHLYSLPPPPSSPSDIVSAIKEFLRAAY